jgi:ribosome recycling factor
MMQHTPMNDLPSFQSGLQKTIAHLKSEFSKLQTGRASASLVENVSVEAYGQRQLLKAIAGISVQDAKTIVVQPWDKSVTADIEKALQKADLGTNPVNEGSQIRIVLPPMTEERRKRMSGIVHELAEEARISIRQQRKEVHTNAKKDAERSEDEHRSFEEDVQNAVDQANAEIEEIAKKKEEEVMKV